MMLYKYRNDNKYTENIFRNKEVWLSTAEALNDPFECTIQEIAKDWIESEVHKIKGQQIHGLLLEIFRCKNRNIPFCGLNNSQLEVLLDNAKNYDDLYDFYCEFMEIFNGNPPGDPYSIFSNIDKQLNDVGIFSLTEDPINLLMWAHYGQENSGIAIGFDVIRGLKLADPYHCKKVLYSDDLPRMTNSELSLSTTYSFDILGNIISRMRIAFEDEEFQKAISTKSSCWEYEKEWRYIEEYSGLFPLPSKITEINFGLKCSMERQIFYKNLCQECIGNDVVYYVIEKEENSNRLNRRKVDSNHFVL
jgi:hypothetical protein